jgi:hypothetical protein
LAERTVGGPVTIRDRGFDGRQAPCGQIVAVESHEDLDDDDVHVTEALSYACGCRSILHEYHDGSMSRKIIHHNGKVLVDELLSAE